jgi:MFS family permease
VTSERRRVTIDISPLRDSPRWRTLWAGHVVGFLGAQITVIAVGWQVFTITHSSLAVGLIGAVELVPLLALGLVGGALADARDRRTIVALCDTVQLVLATALALNAFSAHPRLWVVYVLAACISGTGALSQPALWAMTPRLVATEQYAAASALESTGWNIGAIVGPSIAGVLIHYVGLSVAYVVDAGCMAVAVASALRIGPMPPTGGAQRVSLSSIADGFRFLRGKPMIQGTYLIDTIAMVFGMPRALFPAIAARLGGGSGTYGWLAAAPAAGAFLATLVSGWTARVHRHGRAVTMAVVVWGAAIALFGLSHWVWLAVLCLAVAGAADLVSVIFRRTIWNAVIPDELRGRLGGIAWVNVRGGPVLGDIEAGVVARVWSPAVSATSGGLLCIAGVAVMARLLPSFNRYDRRTLVRTSPEDG